MWGSNPNRKTFRPIPSANIRHCINKRSSPVRRSTPPTTAWWQWSSCRWFWSSVESTAAAGGDAPMLENVDVYSEATGAGNWFSSSSSRSRNGSDGARRYVRMMRSANADLRRCLWQVGENCYAAVIGIQATIAMRSLEQSTCYMIIILWQYARTQSYHHLMLTVSFSHNTHLQSARSVLHNIRAGTPLILKLNSFVLTIITRIREVGF